MDEYILAIDIGTTNIKCSLFSRNAKFISHSEKEYLIYSQNECWIEQNALDWWNNCIIVISDVLNKSKISAKKIKIVAVSSQAPTMLPVDKSGNPLRNAIIWMDRRSQKQCDEFESNFGSNKIFDITGNKIDPYYMFGKLLWFRHNEPHLFTKTYKILQANGFINYKFTGVYSIDCAHASITQIYDVKKNQLSKSILNFEGLDSALFPEIYKCSDIIGTITKQAEKDTGLLKGTPVIAGTVDGAAAAIEAGVTSGGVAAEMSGTSSVLLVGSESIMTNPKLTYMQHAVAGKHLLLGTMSTTGGALKWLKNQCYSSQVDENNVYAQIDSEIEHGASGPTKLIFLPYLAGERSPIWDSSVRGTFLGINIGTTRAELARSILEGAAYALRDNMNEVKKTGIVIKKVRSVGGHTNSDIWLKIKASIINMPIEVPQNTIGSLGGLYCLASFTLGDYSSISQAVQEIISIEKTVDPVDNWVLYYNDFFDLFKSFYNDLKKDYERLMNLKGIVL